MVCRIPRNILQLQIPPSSFITLFIVNLMFCIPSFASKIYVVSPSGLFPQSGSAASWIPLTDLAVTLKSLTKSDTVYLCEGEEFLAKSGPFAINSGRKISTYPCNPALAGIKPVLTMAPPKYIGTPDTCGSKEHSTTVQDSPTWLTPPIPLPASVSTAASSTSSTHIRLRPTPK